MKNCSSVLLLVFAVIYCLQAVVNAQDISTPTLYSGVQQVGVAESKNWTFYQFTMPKAYEFIVTVRLEDLSLDMDLYMLRDYKPALYAYEVKGVTSLGKREIVMNRFTTPAIDVALYYVGVYCAGNSPCPYSILLTKYNCPKDCSGKGTCDTNTFQCTCNAGFIRDDCSAPYQKITAGQPIQFSITDDYYFSLPITQLSFNKYDKLHIDINVPESIGDQPYYLVFLRHDKIPTRSDYDLRRIDSLKFNYTFEVANTELKVNSTLYGWIVNEELSTLPMTLNAYFLTNCPGHPVCANNGVCDTKIGQCKCNANWYGNDCSVQLPTIEQSNWQKIGLFFGGALAGFMSATLVSIGVLIVVIRRMRSTANNRDAMEYHQQM